MGLLSASSLLAATFLATQAMAYTNFLEAMRSRPEEGNFYLEARQAEEIYPADTRMPFGSFANGGTITIEQFVKELKKRKAAKEAIKKKKKESLGKKAGSQKTTDSRNKKNKKTGGGGEKRRPSPSAHQKTRKSKPSLKQPTTGKSQRKQKKNVKQANASQKKKITIKKKTPLLKPSSRPAKRKPILKVPTPAKTKPSTAKKPAPRPKKKVVKQEVADEEDDDLFNFGSSSAQTHSAHHIHHHDHLEAHKHHHKHKESHAHEHAHSNDHVHNHKHTHNHVHNHVHKHNEAHEHTAEHEHTEKHTHKHLEYIDQGGWRRREDQGGAYYGGEGIIMEEPHELVLQEREGRNDNPRLNVKHELQKFIESYKAHSPNSFKASLAGVSPPYSAGGESGVRFNEHSKQKSDYAHHDIYEEAGDPGSKKPEALVSPLENASPHPVEVEEITYEEYLRLQEKGPTFEEELDEYEDYQTEGFQQDYDGYRDNYATYGPVDQLGHGSEEDQVMMPEYEGDWVDMDIDLQYDLGPEYLDYQELERNYAAEGRSIPDYEQESDDSIGSVEGRSIASYDDYPELVDPASVDQQDEYQDQPVSLIPLNEEIDEYGEDLVDPVNHEDFAVNLDTHKDWPSYEEYTDYIESVKESPITVQSGEGLPTETLEQVKEETDQPYVLDYQNFL